jgi:septum site-determining protein MinD
MAASPTREDGEITPLHMQVLCRKLRQQFDYILIDGPAGINDGLMVAVAGADQVVIITLPDYGAIRDADYVDRFLERLGAKERCCVINKVIVSQMNRGLAPSLQEISRLLRIPIVGVIQYDENINISSNYGLPIVYKRGTYIYENLNNIVDRIIEQ